MAELQAKVDRDGRLDLQNCGLETVPPDVGQLVGLKVLDLSNNPKLWSVPAGLAHLPALTGLDISGCPGLATLQKLQAEGGLQAVLGYLKDRANPTLDSLQAKVDRDGLLDLSGQGRQNHETMAFQVFGFRGLTMVFFGKCIQRFLKPRVHVSLSVQCFSV